VTTIGWLAPLPGNFSIQGIAFFTESF